MPPRSTQRPRGSSPDQPASSSGIVGPDPVVVRLRNYDHHRGHAVRVTATDPDDEVAFTDQVFLVAGQTTRMTKTIDPTDYTLQVRVDGVDRTTVTCRLDDTPSGTAVVELGNGAVSATAAAER